MANIDRFGSRLFRGWTIEDFIARHDHVARDEPTPPKRGLTDSAVAYAEINHGRWIIECPFCPSAQLATMQEGETFFCVVCRNAEVNNGLVPVVHPSAKQLQGIEKELVRRRDAATRNWRPGENVASLRAENKRMGVEEEPS